MNINTSDKKMTLPEIAFEALQKKAGREATLCTFLPAVKDTPRYGESAKSRLYCEIMLKGVNELRSDKIQRIYGKPIIAYNAFREFYGIELPIHEFVTNLQAAVYGGEQDNQVFVLIGPKGSSKSQFAKKLKKILKGSNPIPQAHGCPQRENPLNLLFLIHEVAEQKAAVEGESPSKYRLELLKGLGLDKLIDWDNEDVVEVLETNGIEASLEGLASLKDVDDLVSAIVFGLGLPRSTRANIGHPCMACQEKALGLCGHKQIDLVNFPISSFTFKDDQQGSVGICSVKEVQPLNYDIRVMVGEEDIAKLAQVERNSSESVILNGAYNLSNRGMLEFVEDFKNPIEAHRTKLEATQDKSVPAPDPLRRNLHIDNFIIAHSNAPEFKKFKDKPENEPYLDRFIEINWIYPLEYSEAKKVVLKLWKKTDFARKDGVHLEATVAEYMAIFEVLTRIEEDEAMKDMMMKVYAYNGDEGRLRGQGTKIDTQALKKHATPYEGMEGVSPRFTAKLLTALASDSLIKGCKCVTSRSLRDRLYERIRLIPDEKVQEKYRTFVSKYLDDWRRKKLARAVLGAMVEAFPEECQSNFDKYVDHAKRTLRPNASSSYSSWGSGPDEDFLRAVEADPDLNITSAQAKGFRSEVVSAINDWMTEHKQVNPPYTCYEPLRFAIERYVCDKVKATARIISSRNARSSDDNRKLKTAKERLQQTYGFCEHCADEVLKEAEETKDFLKEV
jgi:serine protein kinase